MLWPAWSQGSTVYGQEEWKMNWRWPFFSSRLCQCWKQPWIHEENSNEMYTSSPKWSKSSQPVVKTQDAKHLPSAQGFHQLSWQRRRRSYQEKQRKHNPNQTKPVLEEEKISSGKLVGWMMAPLSQLSSDTHSHMQALMCAHTDTQIYTCTLTRIQVIIKRNHIYYTGRTWYLKQPQDHRPLKQNSWAWPSICLDSTFLRAQRPAFMEAGLHGLHNQASCRLSTS